MRATGLCAALAAAAGVRGAAGADGTTFITLGDWGGKALGSYKATTVAARER